MLESFFATNENIKKMVRDAVEKFGPACDLNFIDVSCVSDM